MWVGTSKIYKKMSSTKREKYGDEMDEREQMSFELLQRICSIQCILLYTVAITMEEIVFVIFLSLYSRNDGSFSLARIDI